MKAEILAGPERRRRWSDGEKARIVAEAAAPGARVADIARRIDQGADLCSNRVGKQPAGGAIRRTDVIIRVDRDPAPAAG